MGDFSIIHGLVIAVVFALSIVPAIVIIRKAGFSGWWILLMFVPIGNLIGYLMFAFADWPALRDRTTRYPTSTL